MRNRSNDALGPEAKPAGRATVCPNGLDDIDRRKAFA